MVERELDGKTSEESKKVAVKVSGNVISIAKKRSFSSHANVTRHKFDKVFGPRSDQREVFETTKPLIDAALEGYNSTIFAYGQTGGTTFFFCRSTDM